MWNHKVKGLGRAHLGDRQWVMENSNEEKLPGKKCPTQFNPAYDTRAGSFSHKKGTYYDVDSSKSSNDLPHISTRGGAMYIIDKVMMSIENWEEAKGMLQDIGGQTGGFDFGARPWDMFGKQLPKDPFAVDAAVFNRHPEKTKPKERAES